MATSPAERYQLENRLYFRTAIALSILIVAGFSLSNVIGITNFIAAPASTKLHGTIMAALVVLFLVQNILGTGRNLALHRKLGYFGIGLAIAAVLTAWNTAFVTTAFDRAPPVFSPPYFLAMTLVQPVFFGAMVVLAITYRKKTDWHRRFMLGSLMLVLEPAIGRLEIIATVMAMGGPEQALPFLSTNTWFIPMLDLCVQLIIIGLVMLGDRAIRGSVHPALKWVLVGIIALYAGNLALSLVPQFAEYAYALKGSAL